VIFYITVVGSSCDVVGMGLGYIHTYQDDQDIACQKFFAVLHAANAYAPDDTLEYVTGMLSNDELLATGRAAFTASCAACHGQAGEGMIGPNLTDDHWLHGGSLTDIYGVVYNGVLAKGMPAWGNILSHDDAVSVVIYINSLQGTNPP